MGGGEEDQYTGDNVSDETAKRFSKMAKSKHYNYLKPFLTKAVKKRKQKLRRDEIITPSGVKRGGSFKFGALFKIGDKVVYAGKDKDLGWHGRIVGRDPDGKYTFVSDEGDRIHHVPWTHLLKE